MSSLTEINLAAALNKALTVVRPENHWQVLIVAAELADALNVEIWLNLSSPATGPKFEARAKR